MKVLVIAHSEVAHVVTESEVKLYLGAEGRDRIGHMITKKKVVKRSLKKKVGQKRSDRFFKATKGHPLFYSNSGTKSCPKRLGRKSWPSVYSC